VQPKIVRRSVSADTAAVLTGIMESVVERGTGRAAQIPGYTIAGKTGTATKLVNGNYSGSDYNASFVGFLPSNNPAVAIIVVIDSPHAGPYTGGLISAPIFRRIAESTLRYLGIGPTLNPAPPVIIARRDEASGIQTAAPETAGPVVSFVDGAPPTMPDLSGMSAREAMRKLMTVGLTARISGDGFVVSQDPPAGAPLEGGGVSRVMLERSPARHLSSAAQP
jgi:membrane peptidoglycan carboxypeptidase